MENSLRIAKAIAVNLNPEEEMVYDYIERLCGVFKCVSRGNEEKIEDNLSSMPYTDQRKEELIIPGIPGTFHNAIVCILTVLSDVSIGIERLIDKPKKRINDTAKIIRQQLSQSELASVFRDIEGTVMTTKNTSEMIKTLAEQNNEIVKKIDQIALKMVKTQKPSEKHLKELLKLYNEVLSKRVVFNPQRMKILGSLQNSQNSYISLMRKFVEYLMIRDNSLIQLINEISESCGKFSEQLLKSKEILEICSSKIDMKYDFKVYTQAKRIFRYDLVCPEFIEIDYQFDNMKITREIRNDYPVALAEVVENFICGGENEISCTKGKYLLLMEFPDEEWCCVTNPFTHSIGYVPSYCVKPISTTLGICIREPKQGETMKGLFINIGDFVSIVNNDPKEKFYHIFTARGEKGTASKGLFAIIYGE